MSDSKLHDDSSARAQVQTKTRVVNGVAVGRGKPTTPSWRTSSVGSSRKVDGGRVATVAFPS